jgi:hypothetical protein
MRQSPRTLHVVKKGAGDGSIEEEIWNPEELVVETGLRTRLGSEQLENDIPTAAIQTAQKLKAHWTTYVALRKSALGIGLGDRPFRGFMHRGPAPQLYGTNVENLQAQLPPPDLEEAAKQERNDLFERLTPEQRVRRARELTTQTRIESQNVYENN